MWMYLQRGKHVCKINVFFVWVDGCGGHFGKLNFILGDEKGFHCISSYNKNLIDLPKRE